MHILKNLNISHKIKLALAIFLLTLSSLVLDVKKSYTFVVETPVTDVILKKMYADQIKQIAKITTQVAVLESQLEQAKAMASSLADGEITVEMVDFAFEQAEKCGFKPPSIPFPDFPSLTLPKLCDGKNSIEEVTDKMAMLFSYKHDMNAEERAKVTANRRVLTKDSNDYSLALGASGRTLDASKKKENWTGQMKQSQSLAHQMHMSNSIAINIYDELVELRRVNSALLELMSLIYGGEDITQHYDKQGNLKQ